MKSLIIAFGGQLVKALATRSMLVWALEKRAICTKNKLDNHAVALIKAMLYRDAEKIRSSVKALANEWLKEPDNETSQDKSKEA